MINKKKVLALIPARKTSKGLLNKNIKNLLGKPLFSWPLEAAKKSKYIDRCIVSTDDERIYKFAKKINADVPFKRPKKYSTDNTKSISVIKHALSYLKKNGQTFDYLILLEPTSPLTTSKDIDNALKKLDQNRSIADSIVGVSEIINTHPDYCVKMNNHNLLTPFNSSKFNFVRRQKLSKIFFFDGSLYISEINTLMKKKSFYHSRTLGFTFPKWKSLEIDDLVDFFCVEAILNNYNLIHNEK
jgi:N-acylneuraminate cytidylyltransferase/CMP-N,N'-diacetyllegionaminic acid synthase